MTVREMQELVATWDAKTGTGGAEISCPGGKEGLGERFWQLVEQANGCGASLEELFIAELERKNSLRGDNL